jgi:protein-tyrosine phosphatase
MSETLPRRLALAGVTNFRDLGGYPGARHGVTRWRHVFRSDGLFRLTEEGARTFAQLEVRTVIDLRHPEECKREPGPLACINLELPSTRVWETDPSTLRSREDGERWLREDYLGMLAKGATVFGELFGLLADQERLPAVFCCSGGKDRTGLAAALLLLALGVDRETVLGDYQATSLYREARHVPDVVDLFVESGIARPAASAMLSPCRWAMDEALDTVEERYGGIEAYLYGPGQMTRAALARLRAGLLEHR